jgi:3-methyl-2-oxobutanoate hydroxymethyltransferase
MEKKKPSKITSPAIRAMKRRGQPITMLTAYDATFARLLDGCAVEILLVGDSLGMVVQGCENTLAVTLDHVIYHTRAVSRGVERAQVVADMPFMTYQNSVEEGLANAGRLVKEGRAEAVKLEGGQRYAELVSRLTEIGIPVMGHIGLTPQSVHVMGGYRVQGRNEDQAHQLMDDAIALEEAGAYCLVLEGIPREVAEEITGRLSIPTIGIGAGPGCDGQVLVIYDLLGMDDAFSPRFVKRYDNLAARIREAVSRYAAEVRSGEFPGPEHCFSVKRGRVAPAPGEESGRREPAEEPIPLYPSAGRK